MGTIVSGPGGPLTVSSASGGKIYGYNNISESAPIVVANSNAARQKITFHNPGTNDLLIAPVFVQNTIGTAPAQPSDTPFNPTSALFGGCFRIYGNGGMLAVEGECQGAWQALAVTGAGSVNPLTVMESNI